MKTETDADTAERPPAAYHDLHPEFQDLVQDPAGETIRSICVDGLSAEGVLTADWETCENIAADRKRQRDAPRPAPKCPSRNRAPTPVGSAMLTRRDAPGRTQTSGPTSPGGAGSRVSAGTPLHQDLHIGIPGYAISDASRPGLQHKNVALAAHVFAVRHHPAVCAQQHGVTVSP